MKRRMILLLKITVFAYAAILLLLFFLQRHYIYFPTRGMEPPEHYGAEGFRTLSLRATDGIRLTAWHHDPQPGYPTIVYFHGNAGHLGFRIAKYQALANGGYGVLALSYRGFGSSEGTPSEQGLYEDARAAIHYALGDLGLPIDRILLYGESLGSGVAVQMATEYPVAGLILEAPYTSVIRRGEAMFPRVIPVALLLKDRFNSIEKITQVKAPLLLFHGERDTVIPVSDGRELLAAANEPKEGLFFSEVDHTQFPLPELLAAMDRFGQVQGWFNPLPVGSQQP
jgi:fermentation-respiration switch protein FrsA (DUF1100 family)